MQSLYDRLPDNIKERISKEEFDNCSLNLQRALLFENTSKETSEYSKISQNIRRYISEDVFESMPENIKEGLTTHEIVSDAQVNALSKIPWGNREEQNEISVQNAKEILETSHLGLEDIKHRVIRYIACQKHLGSSYGTVLLFCGPAGVGKTSIVRSISRAMGRPMVKISLAGVSDADVLKGTSTIYSNSRPGRIVEAIINSKSFSPIILFDEIDKIARNSGHGDPQYALLDILDSDRSEFIDECLGFPLDLRNVIFIATANDISEISPILLDRLEVIKIKGYTEDEKLDIVQSHLLPDLYEYYNLDKSDVELEKHIIKYIIRKFSKEPGIRKMRNILKQIFEEIIYYREMGIDYHHKLSVSDINEIFSVETSLLHRTSYYNYSDWSTEEK